MQKSLKKREFINNLKCSNFLSKEENGLIVFSLPSYCSCIHYVSVCVFCPCNPLFTTKTLNRAAIAYMGFCSRVETIKNPASLFRRCSQLSSCTIFCSRKMMFLKKKNNKKGKDGTEESKK